MSESGKNNVVRRRASLVSRSAARVLSVCLLYVICLSTTQAQTPAKRFVLVNNVLIPFDGFVAPPQPQSLRVTVSPPYGASIAWNESADTTRYRLEKQDYVTKAWSSVYVGPNTAFSLQGLSIGRHYFRVYACGGDWCSDSSSYKYIDIGLQFDTDFDGVLDYADTCPETPSFQIADLQGCSISQRDTDSDGVNDAIDLCPNTNTGVTVSAAGCIPTIEDSDSDGITNDLDRCDDTSSDTTPNSEGCALSQLDSDFDGVTDDLDHYPLQSATQCLP